MFRCLSALMLMALSACNPPDQILVGSCAIYGEDLDRAVLNLQQSFPQFGPDTLAWHLLDEGMGPAALLHAALPTQSARAKSTAQTWVSRLQQGELFFDLAREVQELPPSADPALPSSPPNPFSLGAATAAVAASLKDGEWAGPYRSKMGWEILLLVRREEGPASRAWVTLVRLTATVGNGDDRAAAKSNWLTLPLDGTPQRLRSLPAWFRLDRIATPPK